MASSTQDTVACEQQRLHALQSTRLLESGASAGFDRITRLARHMFGVSIAAITLLDADRQWYKSVVGMADDPVARGVAFCDHAIRSRDVMVVEDAHADPRFCDNPLVTGAPRARFYAGAPVVMPSGHALGTLCLIDNLPRRFDAESCRRLQDMAQLVLAQIELHQSSGRIDPLTRLPNRSRLAEDLHDLCLLAPGGERTLVLVDIMGHEQLQATVRAMGTVPLEAAMRDIAARLRTLLDAGTTLYHVSETRFAFLCAGPDRTTHEAFASALLLRMRAPFTSGDLSVELSAHAGLAAFALDAHGIGDVLRQATTALYRAAAEHQDVIWYVPGNDVRERRAFAMLREIPRALGAGEFRLVYQPKLDLRSLRYTGVEALIRWRHPRHGDIPPADFIPLVENTPLIHLLTEWVLHAALSQLAAWQGDGLALTVAVNVSACNLEHPAFLRMLRDACAAHSISPELLHIECTENAALTGRSTLRVLQEVQAMGIQVSLDDFGTGYCNLACLHSLPAKLLKLDQSLIRPITTDPRAWALLQSIIALGQSQGYRLLAEGVETAEVFDRLVSAGCDAVQGYYLSRPLEPQALRDFVVAHDSLYRLDPASAVS